MAKKLGLWVGTLAVAVALGGSGAAYYWMGSNQQDEKLLTSLAARGLAYESVSQEDGGSLKFVGATLDVGQDKPATLNNFTAIKAKNGYDVSFEQMEVAFAGSDLKLTLPQVEIKGWEFADKIDATKGGLSTPAYLSPFLHDKAMSIRFDKPHLKGDFTFVKAAVSVDFTVGETLLEGVDSGKIASYRDKDIALTFHVDPDTIEVNSELTREILKEGDFVTVKVTRDQLQDFNLKRLLEFVFLNSDNPDGPFEQIYSGVEIEDYQLSQFNGMATSKYNKITASATTMRGAKKAPVTAFQELFAMIELAAKEESKPDDDERILATMVDVFSIIKMIGEQKSSAEGISLIQNYPEIGQIKMDAARAEVHLKEASIDFSYHDMVIDTPAVDISIGHIGLENFAHIRMVEGWQHMIKTLINQQNEESERSHKEKSDEMTQAGMRFFPHFDKFSIDNFHLKGADNFPYKAMIGEWSFDTISFENAYAFEAALLPTSFAFEIKDFSLPLSLYEGLYGVSSATNEIVACLLEDKEVGTFSFKLQSEWDGQTQSLKIPNNVFSSNVTGIAGLDMQLGNITENFFSFDPMVKEEEAEQISLQSLKLSFDPEGNDEPFLNCMATQSGLREAGMVNAQGLRAFAVMGLRMATAPDEDLEQAIKPLRESLIGFIQDGGKIELSVKAKDPAGVTFKTFDDDKQALDNPFELFEVELTHQ